MKNTKLLFALAASIGLVACGGGGGGSDSPPSVSVGMVCNPDGNSILLYGETATVTATLPGPTTATITFQVASDDVYIWSATSCNIVNGTSCSVSVLNVNISNINAPVYTVQGSSYGYLSGGCKLPTFLHS